MEENCRTRADYFFRQPLDKNKEAALFEDRLPSEG